MDDAFKLGSMAPDGTWHRHDHGNLWAIEPTSGRDRLVLAPSRAHVDLMIELLRALPEPFCILHVLITSRCGSHLARRQHPQMLPRSGAAHFLREYEAFFEGDGRHHVWVMSVPAEATIVYDNHDLLYAYGPLERFVGIAAARGMNEGEIGIPAPHMHGYHEAYDEAEERLLSAVDWLESPLQPGDDP